MTELVNIKAEAGRRWGTVEISWDYSNLRSNVERVIVEVEQRSQMVRNEINGSNLNKIVISELLPYEPAKINVYIKNFKSEILLQDSIEATPEIDILGGIIDTVGILEHDGRICKGRGSRPAFGIADLRVPNYWNKNFRSNLLDLFVEHINNDTVNFIFGFSKNNINIKKVNNLLFNHLIISYDKDNNKLFKYNFKLHGKNSIKTTVLKDKLIIPVNRNLNDLSIEQKINHTWITGIVDKRYLEI